jgi:hypothetical protein
LICFFKEESENQKTVKEESENQEMTDAISGVEIAHPSGAHEFISGP